jgi:class 3 adenylate cyclase/PAS domain-containing protein
MVTSSSGHLNRYELETLYEIARTLNSTLDLDEVLLLVMDRVIKVVRADRGFLMLVNPETNKPEFKIARNAHAQTIAKNAFKISMSSIQQVVKTRLAVTDTDLFDPTVSMQGYGIYALMCAPLIVREKCIGAVYIDLLSPNASFQPKQLDLLIAFCHQAAIAIDNARLFELVNEGKQYMDNIFASIANGVITINAAGIITTFNVAAATILKMNPLQAVGQHYQHCFSLRPEVELIELLHNAQQRNEATPPASHKIACTIPGRNGQVYLNITISALRDPQGAYIGTALVIDDYTAQKRKEDEAQEVRHLFKRFVHPSVVEQLMQHPKAVKLGGELKEVTVVFADIRGYTRLCERLMPEQAMHLINIYMGMMVEIIWEEEGTITGFKGDEVMAIFNAPLPQRGHALHAIRAVWKMRQEVLSYQRAYPQGIPIAFGFGVNTGVAVVGNIGSEERIQNYTAIGDTVNIAARLQAGAAENSILLSEQTYLQVYRHIQASEPFPLEVKNRTTLPNVRRLQGLY